MKEIVVYKTQELLRLLPGFEVANFSVKFESEDDCGNATRFYLTNRKDIKSITEYHSLFGLSVRVVFDDGESVSLESDNLTSSYKPFIYRTSCDFISANFDYSEEYIKPNEYFIKWLKNKGISQEQLDVISDTFTLYETVEYPGVSTPVQHNGHFGYLSKNLVLDEREIEEVLSKIKDKLLREKIKCILYARVFKRM